MAINSDLSRGVAEPIILKLLSVKMMYGYEIIREVNLQSNGEFAWKEGSLYPCLHKLEVQKLIQSSWILCGNKQRKYYTITAEGLNVMAEKTAELKKFATTIALLMA